MTKTFADLGLDPRVVRALADAGYETPTAIQAETVPLLLAGSSVVGLAQTGTGKTAAFAAPILSCLDDERTRSAAPQTLVLTPTRELALQVSQAFARYARHLPELSIVPVYGGQSYGPQLAALRRGADVVVGTPGRVIDHLKRRTLNLTQLRFLVLDEADEMLQMGFAEEVETIVSTTPASKQVALFSATMPPGIRRIAQQYLTDPVEVSIKEATLTKTSIRQRYLLVRQSDKGAALARLLETEPAGAAIIFVRTKSATEELARQLAAAGHRVAAINGDLAQAQRERVISQLKSGALDLVVATDVAARGLDVDRITLVVNYDIPTDPQAYVHRIGRTGRAGRSGEALLLVTPRERGLLRQIEKTTRHPIEQMQLPSSDAVLAARIERFTSQLGATLTAHHGSADFGTFQAVLATYAADAGVDPLDLAAALAIQARRGEPLLAPQVPDVAVDVRDVASDRGERVRSRRAPRGERTGANRGTRQLNDALVPYRIEVGRRHKIAPGAVVGALANEGGLNRQDFGHIDIRVDHTIVDLPADLPAGTHAALAQTRISGKLINLSRLDRAPVGDAAPRGSRNRNDRPAKGNPRGDSPRKPRRSAEPRTPSRSASAQRTAKPTSASGKRKPRHSAH